MIQNFVPNVGRAGTDIVVTGTGFNNATGAQIGGVPSAFLRVSDTEVQITVPLNALTGKVTILDPDGNQVSADDFIVSAPIAPETTARGLEALDVLRLATLAKNANDAKAVARHLNTETTFSNEGGENAVLTRPSSADLAATATYENAALGYFKAFDSLRKMIIIGDAIYAYAQNGSHYLLRRTSAGLKLVAASGEF